MLPAGLAAFGLVFSALPSAANTNAADAAATITVDFARTTATASKFNFGIATWPKFHSKYASLVAETGVTILRDNVYLYDLVPRTTKAADGVTEVPTTVETYNLDLHRPGGPIGAANPANWHWDPPLESEVPSTMDLARWKQAGLSLLLVINSVPSWLGYDSSMGTGWNGGDSSVPRDWGIWTDINKKAFAHYKDKADYFQSINEPDVTPGSLSLRGSSYTNTLDAYKDIYYHAWLGWKQVPGYQDKKFGGPSTASSDPYFLASMLGDERIKHTLQFASWHSYGGYKEPAGNLTEWRAATAAAGFPNLPLFITEWGWSADFNADPMNNGSIDTISYAGLRLTSFINAGADAAFLYTSNDDPRAFDAGVRNHFTYVDKDGKLQPKAATFRLLSKKLGLGKGTSRVVATQSSGITIASAAINSNGQRVFWLVNDEASERQAKVELQNIGLSGKVTLAHFRASAQETAKEPIKTESARVFEAGALTVHLSIPPKAVQGVVVDSLRQPTPGSH